MYNPRDTHHTTRRPFMSSPYLSSHSPPSSPSSQFPLSPPPLRHEGSPYARVPLPPVEDYGYTVPPSINRVLRYSPHPTIDFDLLRHPSTITTLPDRCPLSLYALSEPATVPPMPFITIVSPHLPCPITVNPQIRSANAFVTVSDVLITLHHVLGLPVSLDEHGYSPSGDAVLRARDACHRRVESIPDRRAREAERSQGVKRIDLLMGRRRFLGLSLMGRDTGVFVLNVA